MGSNTASDARMVANANVLANKVVAIYAPSYQYRTRAVVQCMRAMRDHVDQALIITSPGGVLDAQYADVMRQPPVHHAMQNVEELTEFLTQYLAAVQDDPEVPRMLIFDDMCDLEEHVWKRPLFKKIAYTAHVLKQSIIVANSSMACSRWLGNVAQVRIYQDDGCLRTDVEVRKNVQQPEVVRAFARDAFAVPDRAVVLAYCPQGIEEQCRFLDV